MADTETSDQKLNFEQNELVLCFHGPLLYEAKILKAENWGPEDSESGDIGPHYYVHYKGWKKTWDEWVPEERVVKHNEANLMRQKQLKDTYSSKKKKTVRIGHKLSVEDPTKSNDNSASPPSHQGDVDIEDKDEAESQEDQLPKENYERGKKRKKINDEEEEEEFMNRLEIKIPLPESLKVKLIDDWENVTRNNALLKLPRKYTVADILNEYLESKHNLIASTATNQKSDKDDIHSEVVQGIKIYFDKTLGNILLYADERQQYVNIRKQYLDKENSEIYGAEHLLRLFVELPRLLAHTTMDQAATETLEEHLVDFLKFIQKNEDRYFAETEYERHGWVCANCKTSNTPGWRAGETSDKKLCNACGLYFSKYKSHRPEHLWNNLRNKPA
ncbi:MRG-domain-containing protein [Rhizophagus clarus]|uniref:Chromatin modification-related protein EAF3 n=1 Tax=Rhizophagus clarus TaxID=94130 RepID=A0A8H3L656_9GLOM|nr:MRG-domain-containing protein [Rhizophagus clarus]